MDAPSLLQGTQCVRTTDVTADEHRTAALLSVWI